MSRRAKSATHMPQGPLKDIEEHVEGFRQVREAHRRELIDDYVELISDLIREVGEARQVDMAARLGVSQPTVAKMLKSVSVPPVWLSRCRIAACSSPRKARSWLKPAASAITSLKPFCWCWASARKLPAGMRKGWSTTSAMKPSPCSRNFTRIANLQGLLPSCPSCFVP